MPNTMKYAAAISLRIADEWSGKLDFPEDAVLLQKILEKLLIDNPEKCKTLVGTGIVEEDFFVSL